MENPAQSPLLHGDLTYKIRGAIFAVYNELGFGHKEQVYQHALAHELEDQQIPYQKETSLQVSYKDKTVGNYKPDFVIDGKVILEIKAVAFMPQATETQLINYLKATGYGVGLLVNFGTPKVYIKRLVWTNPRKSVPRESPINQRKSLE